MTIKIITDVAKGLFGKDRIVQSIPEAVRDTCVRGGGEVATAQVALTLGKLTEFVLSHVEDEAVKAEFLRSILPYSSVKIGGEEGFMESKLP